MVGDRCSSGRDNNGVEWEHRGGGSDSRANYVEVDSANDRGSEGVGCDGSVGSNKSGCLGALVGIVGVTVGVVYYLAS